MVDETAYRFMDPIRDRLVGFDTSNKRFNLATLLRKIVSAPASKDQLDFEEHVSVNQTALVNKVHLYHYPFA